MSGTFGDDEGDDGFARLGNTRINSALLDMLMADDIIPGSPPSYQLCKNIYVSHPLGSKLAEVPVTMAQSQSRHINITEGPESRLLPAFEREWRTIGVVGADSLIANTMRTSRIYGVASIVVGDRKGDPANPLQIDKLAEMDLYFNILDPLNSAGSLILNQDPNSPDYQKPRMIIVGTQKYHPSRAVVMMNEQPIYIEWSTSAYGYVGRSVYQRALFPLKSFVQSMITDDMVTKKIGLLVWKTKAPGAIANRRMQAMFGWKRRQIKSGITGNVLSIGDEDAIESLNFQNLEGAGRFTRENILKNIATAANMPARMLDQETMVSGFGEGSEDAKSIASYIDRVRIEMQPLYTFFDTIVMRRAWNKEFYAGIQQDYKEYRKIPYDTAFYQWENSFQAVWPNLITEPDSEKIKTEDIRFKAVVAIVEVLAPLLDPDNKATLCVWAAEQASDREKLFSSPLVLDEKAIAEYEPTVVTSTEESGGFKPEPPAAAAAAAKQSEAPKKAEPAKAA